MIGAIKGYFKLSKHRKTWREKNNHNLTRAGNLYDSNDVVVGLGSYGYIRLFNDVHNSKLMIGNYCSLADGVVFLLGHDHIVNTVSTFPFRAKILCQGDTEAISKGNITVNDDVWIGYNSIILSGVTIGQGAVVAAGAVVAKDVPPYAIVGGVPAKVIKYRFETSVIDYLLTLDYGQLTEDLIREHIDDFYRPIDNMPLDDIKKLYAWFPKRKDQRIINNPNNPEIAAGGETFDRL